MTKIRKTQPAFARPVRSSRRKMSPKIEMKIQIAMTQKKNATMVEQDVAELIWQLPL